jgi:hypothetical protein
MSALFLPDFGPGFPPSWGRFFWAKEEPAGVTGGLASADLSRNYLLNLCRRP